MKLSLARRKELGNVFQRSGKMEVFGDRSIRGLQNIPNIYVADWRDSAWFSRRNPRVSGLDPRTYVGSRLFSHIYPWWRCWQRIRPRQKSTSPRRFYFAAESRSRVCRREKGHCVLLGTPLHTSQSPRYRGRPSNGSLSLFDPPCCS